MLDSLVGTGLARRGQKISILTVLCISVVVIEPLRQPEQWVGWFPTLMSTFESASIWLPVLLSTIACWVSGQPRAHGIADWVATSSRSPAELVGPTLVMTAIVAMTAQVISFFILAATSIIFGLRGPSPASDLLISLPTIAAYSLAWAAVGTFLGRSIRREIALPVAALLPYIVFAVMSLYLSDGPFGVLAIGAPRTYDYVRPSAGMILTRGAFWLLVMLCLWLLLLDRKKAANILSWVASLAGALALLQGIYFVPIPAAEAPICQGSAPVTCLDYSHASAMARYRTAIAQLWEQIPRSMRPAVVTSTGNLAPNGSGRVLVVPPVDGVTEPARLVDERFFAARLGNALFLDSCQPDTPGGDVALALTYWWRLTVKAPLDGSAFIGDTDFTTGDPNFSANLAAARRLLHQPASVQSAWFTLHADQILSCAPTIPLP